MPDTPPIWSPFEEMAFILCECLGPLLVKMLGISTRYQVIGESFLEEAARSGNGAILAMWHGRMALPIYHWRNRGYVSLVSLHRDGEYITRIVEKLGYNISRGSSRRGGREGFQEVLRELRSGKIVAMFPDGPRGPRHSLQNGVVMLARLSGAPIFPVSFSAAPHWRFGSWDRFMLQKPASKGIMKIGNPILIARHLSDDGLATARSRLREALIEIEGEADNEVGVSRLDSQE